jgi:4-aminobutyrate aminotransferase-like enzyme
MKQAFKNNKKVKEAKGLLIEALRNYQKNIRDAREGESNHVKTYKQRMDLIGKLRGRPLFFPYISSGVGRGALVELGDGSVKYDFITGIGAHYMGHSHPKILEACVDAAMEDIVMQGNLQLNNISVDVMNRLVNIASAKGAKLKHCFLSTSGVMANENAFKIIFQKRFPASRLLAFKKCFAGRTLSAAWMTDKPQYRQGLPKTLSVDHIPFFDQRNPKGSAKESVQKLKLLLNKHKGQYAGMCFELIQGEGGYHPGERKFFITLMEILKKHHVAVMIDEIQTFGRTTQPFAFQHFGLNKYVDVVTIGKMAQFCATLFTSDYNPKPGLLSQTYTASSASLHAGKVILDEIVKGNYFGPKGKIAQYSKHFQGNLEKLNKVYPRLVKGPYGLGAMVGFTYADGSAPQAIEFVKRLYDNGVLSFSAGANPTRIRFLMPVGAVTIRDIDKVCKIIKQTLLEIGNRGQRPIT